MVGAFILAMVGVWYGVIAFIVMDLGWPVVITAEGRFAAVITLPFIVLLMLAFLVGFLNGGDR